MVYRKPIHNKNTQSDFTICSRCGGKAYRVGTVLNKELGTTDDFTEHCWDCDNVDTTVTVDFGDWRPMKRNTR